MAYVQSNAGIDRSIASDLGKGFFSRLREAYERRKVYTRTLRELNALPSETLADLAISRSGIQRLALEAAYGKNI